MVSGVCRRGASPLIPVRTRPQLLIITFYRRRFHGNNGTSVASSSAHNLKVFTGLSAQKYDNQRPIKVRNTSNDLCSRMSDNDEGFPRSTDFRCQSHVNTYKLTADNVNSHFFRAGQDGRSPHHRGAKHFTVSDKDGRQGWRRRHWLARPRPSRPSLPHFHSYPSHTLLFPFIFCRPTNAYDKISTSACRINVPGHKIPPICPPRD
jgi:hypothetical protein